MNRITFSTALALALMSVALVAVAQDDENPSHARVSFADQGGLIKGTADADWSYTTVNTLVLAGDILWAEEDGSMEIELAGGAFLRMADGSKAEILSLPPDGVFKIWTGSFYIQRTRDSAGTITLETPVAIIEASPDGQIRLDVLKDGSTTVTVRWGSATIRTGNDRPVTVKQGYRSYIDPGYRPSTPVLFDREIEDDFDTWNRERSRFIAFGSDQAPIDVYGADSPLGVADLSAYGRWIYVDNDYYWTPTYVSDYIPYRRGHWNYVYDHGYVWTGYYPFSYVTSHHGYWSHHDHHGWIWRYHNRPWSPAWVATVRYGDHFVWSPIGLHGQPIHFGGAHFSVGGVSFSVHASSFSNSHDILHGQSGVHAFNHDIIGHVNPRDISIWNIDHHGAQRHQDRPQFVGATVPVRSFPPNRVIRGVSHRGAGAVHATDRVNRLERGHGRSDFTAPRGTRTRATRTRVASLARTARVRSVSVRSETLSRTRANLHQAERERSVTRRLTVNGPAANRRTNRPQATQRSSRTVTPSNRAVTSSRTVTSRSIPSTTTTRQRGSRPTPSATSTNTNADSSRSLTRRTNSSQQPSNSSRENPRARTTTSAPRRTVQPQTQFQSRPSRATTPPRTSSRGSTRSFQPPSRSPRSSFSPSATSAPTRRIAPRPPSSNRRATISTPPSRSFSSTRSLPSGRSLNAPPPTRASRSMNLMSGRSPSRTSAPSRSSSISSSRRASVAPRASRSFNSPSPSRGSSRSYSSPSRSSGFSGSRSYSSPSRSSGFSASRGMSSSRGASSRGRR